MRTFVWLVTALLLAAGCAETPAQPKEPTASTTTATPSATVPTMPPAARENTEAGAIAFVKHYIDVFNYASNTGDVAELQRLSDPSCEGCTEYIKLFKGTYEAGGYYRDSEWDISNIETQSQSSKTTVFADLKAPGGTYKSSADDSVHNGKVEETGLVFIASHETSRWLLWKFERQAA